ncbi:glycosyltransferase [uncultured Thiocystis sp.]|uniref:glycosyltransferase family 2 protein n=1 Tax=uncultured Thiocystis sp. TaxID=1202134 RepID=UPI0025F742A2|nr:glycosyltransferase [uncultured Thiocystis sp.]
MQLSDITLVLATRDEASNIAAFLRSIPEEFQLVVVDASRDETPELIEQLRPARSLVLREPGNVTEARQRGAEVARTDLAALLRCRCRVRTGLFRRVGSPR